ncbi:geranylgeranyl pyrophosphate synthetase [Lichtheimia corymbifera JMRC:FSU:9682]|uniref:Geranylgeranyl pyrophosphate synthetase n=1 Tax=Lichtheimia corymbifera JMRC:FSU:9682 TaxID=1263082 RepID=A0A068RWC2_9FUNG|nr:geranylgeranyl pyrophosphate synthetase [Lichtheimia corymbifera JMRC:FSU:9682]
MIAAFNVWLQVPQDELLAITKVIGMLHSASLLIDDVEDDSVLRRGVPAAHHLFGLPQTINCANYVYFLALDEIIKLKNPEMVKIYTGMELYWRDTATCPTEEEFIEMVDNSTYASTPPLDKPIHSSIYIETGGLLRLAVKLMQAASTSKQDYTGLVSKIGIHFQVRDDYMNLQSQQYADNKGFCEDLTEGKFSFPIIHSIRSDPNNRQLLNILKKRSDSLEIKQYALQLLERTGTFDYCRKFLANIEVEARKEIEQLGGNAKLEKIMDMLSIPV